jgi:5-methylcytosine-specific restriction endonuclease McrA
MPKKRTTPRHWREWYQLQFWRNRRAHQLRIEPLCRRCLERGIATPATQADHVEPHRGNWNAFVFGELQSLCVRCHNEKQFSQRFGFHRDVGPDGLPLDPRHPVYRT